MEMTRRVFLVTGTYSCAGLLVETASAQQAPATPAAPTLSGGDSRARRATELVVEWPAVAGASGYDVRIVTVAGAVELSSVTAPLRLTALQPNVLHQVAVRARSAAAASAWSPDLHACTRPPRPAPPMAATAQMIDRPYVRLSWNLDLSGVHNGQRIRVVVGRQTSAGVVAITPPDFASAVPNPGMAEPTPEHGAMYALRLISDCGPSPLGVNESDWSDFASVGIATFGELRLPAQLELRNAAVERLRKYHGF